MGAIGNITLNLQTFFLIIIRIMKMMKMKGAVPFKMTFLYQNKMLLLALLGWEFFQEYVIF